MDSPPTTDLGSPCSKAWTPEWIAAVNAAESTLGHRICGARTPAGNPCSLPPNHENGRCRLHGGFDLTGAPKGNRNAVIHGIYSRRLRQCSPDCPQSATCPCAIAEIQEVPPPDRPVCPYEQVEYNTLMTDLQALVDCQPQQHEFMLHIAHDIALLHVMVNRAALMLRDRPLTEEPLPEKARYQPKLPVPLQAYLRISAEYRRTLAILLPKEIQQLGLYAWRRHHERSQIDVDPAPENVSEMYPFPAIPPTDDEIADGHIRYAVRYAQKDCPNEASYKFQSAISVQPENAQKWIELLCAEYKPRYEPKSSRKDFREKLQNCIPP